MEGTNSVNYYDIFSLIPIGMSQRKKIEGTIILTINIKRGMITKYMVDDIDVTHKLETVVKNILVYLSKIRKYTKYLSGRIKLEFIVIDGEVQKQYYEFRQKIRLTNNKETGK